MRGKAQLQTIAENLVANDIDAEDVISLCSEVSRQQGIELTLKEGSQCFDIYCDLLPE